MARVSATPDLVGSEVNYFASDLGVLIYFSVVSSFNGNEVNDYAEQWFLPGEWVERLLVFIALWGMMCFIDAMLRMGYRSSAFHRE